MISVADVAGFVARLLTGICLITTVSLAGSGRVEADTPVADLVYISADNMKYDMKSGVSRYTGNVRISRSGMELSGNSVTVKQQGDEIESMVINGSPARYRQTAANGDVIAAQSLEMTYSTTRNELVLTDSARLEQAGHIVESQRIIYDTVQEVVIADQINPQDRVNITLTPKKESTGKRAPAPKNGAKTK